MISIREQDYGLNVALYNEFTLDDFKEFENAAMMAIERVHRPDLLLDLTMLKDFTIDMAVEHLKFLGHHDDDFGKVAIVVNDIWIKLASYISDLLTNTHSKYFDTAEEAQAWLIGERANTPVE